MNAASLLAELRVAGIAISCDADRLIVEAPVGTVTAELRAKLVKHKAELIATLKNAHGRLREDPPLSEARSEIARVLAIAYRRCAAIQCVAPDRPVNSGKGDLANSCGTSVHGVVP